MKSRLYSIVLIIALSWSFLSGCACERALEYTGADMGIWSGFFYVLFVIPTYLLTEFILDRVIRMEFGDYD